MKLKITRVVPFLQRFEAGVVWSPDAGDLLPALPLLQFLQEHGQEMIGTAQQRLCVREERLRSTGRFSDRYQSTNTETISTCERQRRTFRAALSLLSISESTFICSVFSGSSVDPEITITVMCKFTPCVSIHLFRLHIIHNKPQNFLSSCVFGVFFFMRI